VLAKLGARSLLIDDHFGTGREDLDKLRDLWDSYGVVVINRDLIRDGLGDELATPRPL
jgi:hypothetical protein